MDPVDVSFIGEYIKSIVHGTKPAEIKLLIYREGGVEISPGNIAPAIIPERLLDHEREVIIYNTGQAVTNGEVTEDYEGKIKIKGVLHDGDPVVVATFTGDRKYIVLEKAV